MEQNKKEKKISFIIPAYNVQKYILTCVKNILAISYENIEIIIIDDGSTDNTLEEVRKILDNRVKIFTQMNQGVSAARNKGIKVASGEYIAFIDADDIVLYDEYTNMLNTINFDKEFYMFAYECLDGDKISKIKLPVIPGVYNKDIAMELSRRLFDIAFSTKYQSDYFGGKVYQYLFEKNFLISNNIFFQEDMKFAEDCIFCFSCFNKVSNFEVLSICPYQYVIYMGSASHRYRNDFWDEIMLIFDKAQQIGQIQLKYKNELFFFYGRKIIRDIVNNFNSYNEKEIAYKAIVKILENKDFEYAIKHMKYNEWSYKEKIIIILCKGKKYKLLYWLNKLRIGIKIKTS